MMLVEDAINFLGCSHENVKFNEYLNSIDIFERPEKPSYAIYEKRYADANN